MIASIAFGILTFNLHCQFNDWEWRMTQVANTIQKLNPDVVLFQEVCDEPGGAAMTREIPLILRRAGYPVAWSRAEFTHWAWDGRFQEHLMVLTRKPPHSFEAYALPSKGIPRKALNITIQQLTVTLLHLDHEKNPQTRAEQIRALIQKNHRNPAWIGMGDWNSSPSDNEQKVIRDQGCRPYFPGPTAPLPTPRVAIDGAWTCGVRPARAQIVLHQPIQGRYLSDHAGVFLYFVN